MPKSMRALTRDIRPEEILAAARLPVAVLVARHGWSNRTWIGDELVVRISSGRLEGSLAHETRVIDLVSPSGVPVAPVVACGRLADLPGRAGEPGEWLISRRLPGDTLAAVWCDLDHEDRARVGRELGSAIRLLHGIQVEDIAPDWWRRAHRPPFLRNAYRPLVSLGPTLVEAARQLPGADQGVLDAAATLLAEGLALFSADVEVLVHGDLHGHNILINDDPTPVITGILDWEGARCGAPDLELDMILRWVSAADDFPECPGAPSRIEPGDCLELVDHLAVGYPELFETPNLRARLEVYDALWHLVQLLYDGYWQASEPNPRPTPSPQWTWFRALLDGRSHLEQFAL